MVFGRTGTVESAAHGVTALLVPMDLPGVTTSRFDCHGQRAIGRGSIFFENVRVPVDHRLGDENKGFVQVMQGFDFSRALIGLQVLAVARVALEETWEYVAQREAFGKPLSAFQGVSHPLADFDTQVEAARLLCLQALWLKDKGLPHSAEAAMCKWWAPKLAYDMVHQCLLMFGHGGYDRGLMEQRLRDVLGFQIGDGTAQIMKTIIARTRAGRVGRARLRRAKPTKETNMEFDAILLPPRRAESIAKGWWFDRTINHELDACVAAYPDKLALTAVRSDSGELRRFTYRELSQLADRIAVGLARLGVGRNDVVSMQLPNWWQFSVLYLACSRIGAVLNPLMHIFRERELSFMLKHGAGQAADRAEGLPRLRPRGDGACAAAEPADRCNASSWWAAMAPTLSTRC